jgi:hypothetical protein
MQFPAGIKSIPPLNILQSFPFKPPPHPIYLSIFPPTLCLPVRRIRLVIHQRRLLTRATDKDTTRVAAGLKANVSPEAKDQAAEKLQNLTGAGIATTTSTTEHENRVLGGFRAVLSSKIQLCLTFLFRP